MVEAALVVFFVLMAPALVLLVGSVAVATIGMVFDVEPRDAVRRLGGFAARLHAPRRRADDLEQRLGQLETYEEQLEQELRGLPGDHSNRAIVEGYLEQVRILRRATMEEMHHATMKKIDVGIESMLGDRRRPEEAKRKDSRRPV
jgi:hypothetical protein